MKTAIVYVSFHHENTKKLVDAVSQNDDIELIDAVAHPEVNLNEYDLIGFASGVAWGKYYPKLIEFMKKNLPDCKNVFFMHTAGSPRENYNLAASEIANAKKCKILGTYFCKGFDTYGPFKLVGGIAKGHPNADEIEGAVEFYNKIKKA